MYEKICISCGAEYVTKNNNQRWCSQSCYQAHRKDRIIPKPCLVCGTVFKTESRAQKYCTRACYEQSHRLPPPSQPCRACGVLLVATDAGRRYCSKACRLQDGWIQPDPSKRSIFTCEWCGTAFETWTYRTTRFCSRACASEFDATQPKPGAPRRPESYITKPCDYCGKAFTVHKFFIENRNTRFCSNECRGAQRSIDIRGPLNPHWTGGTAKAIDYGQNWPSQRRKAVRRDGHTCQVCGYRSGGDVILDVHHIRKVKEMNGDWESANKLPNLIALCRPCHALVEKGAIACPAPMGA